MQLWPRSTPAWECQPCYRKPYGVQGSGKSTTPGFPSFPRFDSECFAAPLPPPEPARWWKRRWQLRSSRQPKAGWRILWKPHHGRPMSRAFRAPRAYTSWVVHSY